MDIISVMWLLYRYFDFLRSALISGVTYGHWLNVHPLTVNLPHLRPHSFPAIGLVDSISKTNSQCVLVAN